MNYIVPENSIILEIKELEYVKEKDRYYNGLYIKTNNGDIKVLISDGQQCCENYGYLFFETPDDIKMFIDATIISIEDIDITFDNSIENQTQLRITTNKGVIQYAIYNEHNGYYSHGTITQVFDSLDKSSL